MGKNFRIIIITQTLQPMNTNIKNNRFNNIPFLLFILVFANSARAVEPKEEYTTIGNPIFPETGVNDTSAVDSLKAIKKWNISNTFISGSVSWKNDDGHKNLDFDLRFGINLKSRLDEIDLRFDANYISKKNSPDDNEQHLRVNWYHTLYKKWHFTSQGRIERNQYSSNNLQFDYAILLGGGGFGYHILTEKKGGSRISVLYNYIDLILIKQKSSLDDFAPSVYFDNNYQLTPKINLKNWTNIIFWGKEDIGSEIETELGYAITKNLTLGFRHHFFANGPTLEHSRRSELKLFTKITF